MIGFENNNNNNKKEHALIEYIGGVSDFAEKMIERKTYSSAKNSDALKFKVKPCSVLITEETLF